MRSCVGAASQILVHTAQTCHAAAAAAGSTSLACKQQLQMGVVYSSPLFDTPVTLTPHTAVHRLNVTHDERAHGVDVDLVGNSRLVNAEALCRQRGGEGGRMEESILASGMPIGS